MASGTMISNVLAKAIADQVTAQLDAGSLGAVMEIRTGSPPANVEAASTGTLLVTITCSDPCFGAATDVAPGARITAGTLTSANAVATGVAGYFIVGSSSVASTIATRVIMGTVGEALDSTDITLDNKNVVTGYPVNITSWVIDFPES